MWKCLLLRVLFFVAVSVIAGCGGRTLKIEGTGTNMVQMIICRHVSNHLDPSLLVLAKEINLNCDDRIIIVKGLTNIAGDNWILGYEWVVPEIKEQGDTLIINIPKDTPYTVYFGKQRHYLPAVE